MKEPYYLICKVLVEKEKILVLDVQASAPTQEDAEKLLSKFPGCRICHGWDVIPESRPAAPAKAVSKAADDEKKWIDSLQPGERGPKPPLPMTPKEIVESHKRLHQLKATGHALIDVQPMPPGAPLIYMDDPPATKPDPDPVPEIPKRRKSRLDVAKAMMPIQEMSTPDGVSFSNLNAVAQKTASVEATKAKGIRSTYWARVMPDGSLVKLGPGRRRSDWKVVEVDVATGKPLGGSP